MHKAVINSHIEPEGFTAHKFSKWEEKSQSISSWTHFYHRPYIWDWRKARSKALDRRWMDT